MFYKCSIIFAMIVKLMPALKSYLWGGRNLKIEYNKESNSDVIAESWELSLNSNGMSTVVGGKYDGIPLAEITARKDWGENCDGFECFPVICKIIDAAKPLSVQVHPSDEYALAWEGQCGKTEMWYILNAEKDAYIYLGLQRDVTVDEFADAIENGTVCDLLNKVSVTAGETYFVPSGTLHAIGAGITLYEIQQNSTLTYRVYDYERTDDNGNKRELHIDKAKRVTNLGKYTVPPTERKELLGKCKYFSAYRHTGNLTVGRDDSFVAVTVINGCITLADLRLFKGETAFISAGSRANIVGDGSYIIICIEK